MAVDFSYWVLIMLRSFLMEIFWRVRFFLKKSTCELCMRGLVIVTERWRVNRRWNWLGTYFCKGSG